MKRNTRRKLNKSNPIKKTVKAIPIPTPNYHFSLKRTVVFISTAIGIISGLIGIYVIYPKVSISVDSLLDSSQPFSTQFVVSNDGELDMHELEERMTVVDAEFISGTVISQSTDVKKFYQPNLNAGDKMSIPMDLMMGSNVPITEYKSLQIAVTVVYRSSFTWWKTSKTQKFYARMDTEGHVHWNTAPS